jgi:replicative DNA helicase
MAEDKLLNQPYNIEAEMSVIGSVLIDFTAGEKVLEVIQPSDFFREEHRIIMEAIATLVANKEPTDIVSVSTELKKRKKLQEVGGTSYLAQLAEAVPNSANAYYYAKAVKTDSICRQDIALTEKASKAFYERDIDKGRQYAEQITQLIVPDKTVAFSDMFDEEEMRRLISLKTWHSSHLKSLTDTLPIGLGELDVIAGRTSTGKTQVALNLLLDFLKEGATVGYVSLEMVKSQVLRRILAYYDDTPLYKIDFRDEGMLMKAQALLKTEEFKNFRFRDDLMDINDIISWTLATRPDVLFLDYIQLMNDRTASTKEYEKLSTIAAKIRSILTRKSAVITLSQMNRKEGDDENDLSKIAGSGRIEQVATGIVFLERRIDDPRLIRYRVLKNQSNGVLTDWRGLLLTPSGALQEVPENADFE